MLNHSHERGQKTPMKPTAPTPKLQSDYSVVHSRPKTAKIRIFDRNLREEKLSFQPDELGGNLFWVTIKHFSEKIHSNKTFFFLLHCVIFSISHGSLGWIIIFAKCCTFFIWESVAMEGW